MTYRVVWNGVPISRSRIDASYRPGQTVFIDKRWPLKADALRTDEGLVELGGDTIVPSVNQCDALVIAVLPGPVREVVKNTRWGNESKRDSRGTALMLLLPDGRYGWIKSDNNYPRVTSE